VSSSLVDEFNFGKQLAVAPDSDALAPSATVPSAQPPDPCAAAPDHWQSTETTGSLPAFDEPFAGTTFSSTEMDNEVFNDYAKSRSGFVALKPGKPMEVFCSSDDYPLVSKYLNLHELMAVGNSQGRLGRGRLLCILGRRSEGRLSLFV
jgi:hypothetical protein